MKPKKKNRFFTFIFSLLPGAAEMYMGFMKMGFSLLAVFAFCVFFPAMMNSGDISLGLAVLVWFYGFFHARNLAATEEAEFVNIQDNYIWNEFLDEKQTIQFSEKGKTWMGWILIVAGVAFLWQHFRYVISCMIPDAVWDMIYPVVNNLPGAVISIIIILLGVLMIRGKKKSLSLEEKEEEGGSDGTAN